ncbi:hypothetical protein BZA70DRAFT_289410 [Myxozyma melibiosi]|uniref:6-O-methylguanine-DNA methyltransferase n=1 Tax=Myxozyma melibiosi TaxID=54550 RepID=A0ABR1F6R2_9ASCO
MGDRKLTDEAEAFYIAVYETVQRIPPGRVTTYGHIARLIDAPQNSRQVGAALKYLRHASLTVQPDSEIHEDPDPYNDPADQIDEEPPSGRFDTETVPWWRVISSDGKIAVRARGGMDLQGERLTAEGVEVRNDSNRRPRLISLREYGWFPPVDDSDSD